MTPNADAKQAMATITRESTANATTNQSPMENLPAELHIMLLRNLDVASLRAFVHASPAAYRLYLSAREDIYTKATLRTLEERDVDIIRPLYLFQVRLDTDNKYTISDVRKALENLQLQTREPVRRSLRLGIDACLALQYIRFLQNMAYKETVRDYLARFMAMGNDERHRTFGTAHGGTSHMLFLDL